ncbi:MAG: flippase activity-associated protein Agl23 [Halodesulfurarchaeum sp.]
MNSRPLGRRRALLGLLGITAVGLLARFFALGFRVFHWDEGRVGYWVLRYMDSGVWEYHAILHGPFLFHVNNLLFQLFGPSDFMARFVVALIGGLLPLVAWLFREHLEDVELVVLGAFLALNPVVLYYSRFMRNDVLTATFGLLAFGLFVRLYDTGRRWYLFGGVGALTLAFATKEIVIVYLGVWLGAAILLLDHRLFVARFRDGTWRSVAVTYLKAVYRYLRHNWLVIAIALLEALVLVVLFYAPRPDLYNALSHPARLPGVIDAATLGSWEKLESLWISGGHKHSYVSFLTDALKTTAYTSLPLAAFAMVGFVVDRYAGREPRDLVAFASYWGIAIYVIYPAITDISAPWSLVHSMVPLAIPAAVGIRLVVDQGLKAHRNSDTIGVGLAALVILAVLAQVGFTAIQTSYRNPQDDSNPLVQYGQPSGYMQATLADVETIAETNDGVDVRYYGDHFFVANESGADTYPAPSNWYNRLPLPWYMERFDVNVDSSTRIETINGTAPVIIARAKHYSEIDKQVSGYRALTYQLTSSGTETVFFIKRSALPDQ